MLYSFKLMEPCTSTLVEHISRCTPKQHFIEKKEEIVIRI